MTALNQLPGPPVHAAVILHLWCSMDSMRVLSTTVPLQQTKFWKHNGELAFFWNNGSLIKKLICQRECDPLRSPVEILLLYECVCEQQEKPNVPCHVRTGTRVLQVHKVSNVLWMKKLHILCLDGVILASPVFHVNLMKYLLDSVNIHTVLEFCVSAGG